MACVVLWLHLHLSLHSMVAFTSVCCGFAVHAVHASPALCRPTQMAVLACKHVLHHVPVHMQYRSCRPGCTAALYCCTVLLCCTAVLYYCAVLLCCTAALYSLRCIQVTCRCMYAGVRALLHSPIAYMAALLQSVIAKGQGQLSVLSAQCELTVGLAAMPC